MADDALPEAPPMRVRPYIPTRKPDESSATSIARDFKLLDDALGALPLRFVRAARSLADKLDCSDEWGNVEAAHAALRVHEGGLT